MHAVDLVQLAGLAASDAPALIERDWRLPPHGVERYWAASKCRLDRWARLLKRFSSHDPSTTIHRPQWNTLRDLLAEILLSEVLARVWAGVLAAWDAHQGSREAGPLGRSVLLGHAEARHRALKLLIYAPGVPICDAVELNRLRRKAERWADLLLSRLVRSYDVSEFASQPERARQFAHDLRDDGQHTSRAWSLMLRSLRAALADIPPPRTSNADLNEQIAASVLVCFPMQQFDVAAPFQSLSIAGRLLAAEDVEQLLEDFWKL